MNIIRLIITKRLDIHTETNSLVGPMCSDPPEDVGASITRNIAKPNHHSVKVNHFLKILSEMKNVNVETTSSPTDIKNVGPKIVLEYFPKIQ